MELFTCFGTLVLIRIFATNNIGMEVSLINKVTRILRDVADRLDAGNSELSESEAMTIMGILCHEVMSKATACNYLNLSRSRFDDLVRANKLPKGKKRVGFKELVWHKDELDACVKQLKNKVW
jgi:predicted DNA-binding transcriptional regulator AlpA